MKKFFGAALGILLLSNCSFFFVRRVPATPTPQPNIQCTTSLVAPALDGILAAYWVTSLALAAFAPERLEAQGIDPTTASVLYSAFLVNRGIATFYGVSNTSRCKAAIAQSTNPQPTNTYQPTNPTPPPTTPPPTTTPPTTTPVEPQPLVP